MRKELKSLRDANKALSLYSSKILDKIIGHGGFESILAADAEPRSPASPILTRKKSATMVSGTTGGFLRSLGDNVSLPFSPAPSTPRPALESTPSNASASSAQEPLTKRARRGLSLDWGRISIWASPSAPKDSASQDSRPHSPEKATPTQAAPVGGVARKLEKPDDEDEEDRKLRERLNAEMRLFGIEKEGTANALNVASSSASMKSTESVGGSGNAVINSNAASGSTTPLSFKSRLPFFRSSSNPSDSAPSAPLTSEALQQAEAVANIAAYEARERAQIDEIVRNVASPLSPPSPASFTEMPAVRPGSSLSERHRRRRAGGVDGLETRSNGSATSVSARSGASTLFSAGRLSIDHNVGEEDEHP